MSLNKFVQIFLFLQTSGSNYCWSRDLLWLVSAEIPRHFHKWTLPAGPAMSRLAAGKPSEGFVPSARKCSRSCQTAASCWRWAGATDCHPVEAKAGIHCRCRTVGRWKGQEHFPGCSGADQSCKERRKYITPAVLQIVSLSKAFQIFTKLVKWLFRLLIYHHNFNGCYQKLTFYPNWSKSCKKLYTSLQFSQLFWQRMSWALRYCKNFCSNK